MISEAASKKRGRPRNGFADAIRFLYPELGRRMLLNQAYAATAMGILGGEKDETGGLVFRGELAYLMAGRNRFRLGILVELGRLSAIGIEDAHIRRWALQVCEQRLPVKEAEKILRGMRFELEKVPA